LRFIIVIVIDHSVLSPLSRFCCPALQAAQSTMFNKLVEKSNDKF